MHNINSMPKLHCISFLGRRLMAAWLHDWLNLRWLSELRLFVDLTQVAAYGRIREYSITLLFSDTEEIIGPQMGVQRAWSVCVVTLIQIAVTGWLIYSHPVISSVSTSNSVYCAVRLSTLTVSCPGSWFILWRQKLTVTFSSLSFAFSVTDLEYYWSHLRESSQLSHSSL